MTLQNDRRSATLQLLLGFVQMSGAVLAVTFVAVLGVTHSLTITTALTTTVVTLVSRRLFGS